MEYSYYGNSGLRVSKISLGLMKVSNTDIENATKIVEYAYKKGINYFDTGEFYGEGKSEIMLGEIIKKLNIPREKLVISTKLWNFGKGPNDRMFSRKRIIEAVNNCLKRLNLDYVDVLIISRFDLNTPVEEVVRGVNYLIEKGLVFYWGTSQWSADRIKQAHEVCEKRNLIKPIAEQTQYNMIDREKIEYEFRDLFKNNKLGISVWGVLYNGILSGKYIDQEIDPKKPENKILNLFCNIYMKDQKNWNEKIKKLKKIAEEKLKCTLAQLAICWVILNPDISTCLIASNNLKRIEEGIDCINIYKKIPFDVLKEIEEILDNKPQRDFDYDNFQEVKSRREIALGV
jgi:voltage-dependent potassium channel beta subunit